MCVCVCVLLNAKNKSCTCMSKALNYDVTQTNMSNDFLLYSICMLIVLTILYCYVDVTVILTIQIIYVYSKHI